MGVFEKIRRGLEEAIAYEQGTLEAQATEMAAPHVTDVKPEEKQSVKVVCDEM